MARSIAQIQDSIKTNLRQVDPTLDLEVGPLWDYLLGPLPPEFAAVENEVERLKRFYSTNFADVATPQEARDFANNFATGADSGGFARATVVFFRGSAPPAGQQFTIPVGALVSTIDGSLIFRALQSATMYGDFASTFYNAGNNRYEIQILVEAVAPGSKYNIPVDRIRKILTSVSGFEGVQQIAAANGGTEPEDSLSLTMRVQDKFTGLDRSSIGGLETLAKEAYPTQVKDVGIVRTTDRIEFRRLTDKPAIDVYVSGTIPQQFQEDYLAIGGETVFPLTVNRTVTSVASVAVNGVTLATSEWTFVQDTSLAYQLSTKATPTIQLMTALTANDLVETFGTRNDLLDRLQLLYSDDDSIYETDILVRAYLDLPVIVKMDVKLNSGDPDTVQNEINQFLNDYIDPATLPIPELLVPNTVKEQLRALLPEVESIRIYEFRRKYGSVSAVEIIQPLKNQEPSYDAAASTITVRL